MVAAHQHSKHMHADDIHTPRSLVVATDSKVFYRNDLANSFEISLLHAISESVGHCIRIRKYC